VPLSKYDRFFGGKPGAATEAHSAMVKQYGAKKGESIFYATKNSNAQQYQGKKRKKKKSGLAKAIRGY
jgi:hypothetical protein